MLLVAVPYPVTCTLLGTEPAANVARAAIELSSYTGAVLRRATGRRAVAERRCVDLVIGNNVLAQVPSLNDFEEGLKILLKLEGVLTLEFPAYCD